MNVRQIRVVAKLHRGIYPVRNSRRDPRVQLGYRAGEFVMSFRRNIRSAEASQERSCSDSGNLQVPMETWIGSEMWVPMIPDPASRGLPVLPRPHGFWPRRHEFPTIACLHVSSEHCSCCICRIRAEPEHGSDLQGLVMAPNTFRRLRLQIGDPVEELAENFPNRNFITRVRHRRIRFLRHRRCLEQLRHAFPDFG